MAAKAHLNPDGSMNFDDDGNFILPGSSAIDPTMTPLAGDMSAYGQAEQLYLQEPGDANRISMNDINQGAWGDCYLLSAIDTFIRKGPQFISNMIKQNADGTMTVKLYEDRTTHAPITAMSKSFEAVYERVDPKLLQAGGVNTTFAGAAASGNVKEIWPQVVEQAYAQLNGGTQAIANGGFASIAMATMSGITGHERDGGNVNSNMISAPSLNFSMLQRLINYNCTIAFDTLSFGNLAPGLISNHGYAYNGCTVAGPNGADTTINLVNPWGPAYGGPTVVALKDVAQNFSMIEVGHASA